MKLRRISLLWFIALRNLLARKLRTILTVAGVVIGMGAIVFLVSLGLGLQHLVTQQVVGAESLKTIDVNSPKPELLKLDDQAINKIKAFPKVTAVIPIYNYAAKINLGTSVTDTVVYGINRDYVDITTLRQTNGKSIDLTGDDQAYINTALLKAIGLKDASQVDNKKLKLTILKLSKDQTQPVTINTTVKGVVDTGTAAELYLRDQVFIKLGVANASQLKVVVVSQTNVAKTRQFIESLGFTTSSAADTLDQVKRLFSYFDIILAAIGSVGLVIAVLGMINTLTISLLERTKEIGLMIMLGARRRDVVSLFVLEALALAVTGGLLGLMMAGGAGLAINLFFNSLSRSHGLTGSFSLFAMPIWLILLTLSVAALVGLIVAIFPARRAARINPVDALRRE